MTDNEALIRRVYDAFAEGDIRTVVSAFAPDIRWTEAEGFPYGGTYVGADEILTGVFMRLGTEWDGWSAVAHEFFADDDTVVVLGEYSGTYKGTGKAFRAPLVHVYRLEHGLIKAFDQHTDTHLARKAMEDD